MGRNNADFKEGKDAYYNKDWKANPAFKGKSDDDLFEDAAARAEMEEGK